MRHLDGWGPSCRPSTCYIGFKKLVSKSKILWPQSNGWTQSLEDVGTATMRSKWAHCFWAAGPSGKKSESATGFTWFSRVGWMQWWKLVDPSTCGKSWIHHTHAMDFDCLSGIWDLQRVRAGVSVQLPQDSKCLRSKLRFRHDLSLTIPLILHHCWLVPALPILGWRPALHPQWTKTLLNASWKTSNCPDPRRTRWSAYRRGWLSNKIKYCALPRSLSASMSSEGQSCIG